MLCLCHFLNNPIAHFYTGNTDASLVLLLFRVPCMQMVSFLLVETVRGGYTGWMPLSLAFHCTLFFPLEPPPPASTAHTFPRPIKAPSINTEGCWCQQGELVFSFHATSRTGKNTEYTAALVHTTLHTSTSVCSEGRDALNTHQKRKLLLLNVKWYKEIECIWWFKTNNTISLLLYIYRSNKTAVKKKKVVGNFPQCWCSAKISTIFQQRCRMCK